MTVLAKQPALEGHLGVRAGDTRLFPDGIAAARLKAYAVKS